MRQWNVIPVAFAAVLGINLSMISGVPAAFAAEEESIEDIKAELAASSAGKSVEMDQFTVSESELEQENSKLQAQEAEILKKMGQAQPVTDSGTRQIQAAPADFESPAPKADVISMRGNIQAQNDSQDFATTEREPVAPPAPANNKELVSLRKTNTELKGKLSQSQEKLDSSQKELKNARDRLMMAEAEVERLSQLLEKRGNSLDRVRASAPVVAPAAAATSASRPAPQAVAARAQEDLPIATVVVDKANLRTGPGTENSALMSVSRGTRLVIETRNGSWYRVFAPNGTRAWITGDVLSFSSSGPESSGSTLRVRAVDASLEKETNRIFGRSVN